MPTVKCRKCYEVFEVRADAEWVECDSCGYRFHTDLKKQLRHSKKATKRAKGPNVFLRIGGSLVGYLVAIIALVSAFGLDLKMVSLFFQGENEVFGHPVIIAVVYPLVFVHSLLAAHAATNLTKFLFGFREKVSVYGASSAGWYLIGLSPLLLIGLIRWVQSIN